MEHHWKKNIWPRGDSNLRRPDGLEHSMSVDWDRRRRFESPRGQMFFFNDVTWQNIFYIYIYIYNYYCHLNQLTEKIDCKIETNWSYRKTLSSLRVLFENRPALYFVIIRKIIINWYTYVGYRKMMILYSLWSNIFIIRIIIIIIGNKKIKQYLGYGIKNYTFYGQ